MKNMDETDMDKIDMDETDMDETDMDKINTNIVDIDEIQKQPQSRKALAREQKLIRKQELEEEERKNQRKLDEKYMKTAIAQAKKAEALDEVPIGCVIVHGGAIIARGYNRRNTDRTALAHAEMIAIRKACKKLGDWRLEGCTMYITLEPCQMCAGAIVQSRMTEVVMAAMNKKAGCGGSVLNLLEMKEFNHRVVVRRGILEEECSRMMSDFFKRLRKKK